MAFTNKLQKVVDQPVWEWVRFNPVGATAAGAALCSVDDGSHRYMYYLHTASFYRYDSWTDSWQLLAAPLTSGATSAALKYSAYSGYRGQVLAATSNSITIPGLKGNTLLKASGTDALTTVRILTGTGAGSSGTTSSISEAVVYDHGFASAGAAASITDATKKWQFNQWQGYQVRIVFGTGAGQIRKILYNDQTHLYIQDANYQQIWPWSNAGFVTNPAANSIYQIEASTLTISGTWATTPDITSTFQVLTGGIWYIVTAGTPGWSAHYFYDIASDIWYPRTTVSQNVSAALGTDWNLERTGEVGGYYVGPTAATNAGSNDARHITDTAASWAVDQWANYQVRITAGTGLGQRRRIVANTATKLEVERNWDVTPGNTDSYGILGDTDTVYLSGNANASLIEYHVEKDFWSGSKVIDAGTARIGSIRVRQSSGIVDGLEPLGISTIVYAASGILTASVTAGGSGYVAADIGTQCTVAGTTAGKVTITNVQGGAVTGAVLCASGSAASAGAQTITGGTGTSAQVTITVGKVGYVTTPINHNLTISTPITMGGDTSAGTYWNGNFIVLGVDTATTFSVAANASASANASYTALSATVTVDGSKSWTSGEHVGRLLLGFSTAGTAPAATYCQRISANTANTVTVGTAFAGALGNGVGRYAIIDIMAFGREEQFRIPTQSNTGYATSAGSTSLVDSTKSWLQNQWSSPNNMKVRIIAGTSIGSEAAVTSNTATQINVASWANGTPDTTSKYIILDNFGIATSGASNVLNDTTKNWVASALIGKRVKFTGGTLIGIEAAITANTATQITMANTADATTTYTILSRPAGGTNCGLQWMFNTSKYQKGKYMLSIRGNSPYFDLYDITRQTFDPQYLFTPQTESMVVGSMYAYDGMDHLYICVGSTGRMLVLDLSSGQIQASGLTPYAQGVGLAGNRMETITTADGLEYLYIMRNTGAEFWRTLAFWAGW